MLTEADEILLLPQDWQDLDSRGPPSELCGVVFGLTDSSSHKEHEREVTVRAQALSAVRECGEDELGRACRCCESQAQ